MNPKRAAQEELIKEIRKAVRAGKTVNVPMTDKTVVTINSKSEDEAAFIAGVLFANMEAGTGDGDLDTFLHAQQLYSTLYMQHKPYRAKVVKHLKKMTNDIERLAKRLDR